jgi:mRNA interferase RelE/StbE
MPYTILYTENVVEEDIPAIPVRQKAQIKKAIDERLGIDPVGLGKPLQHSLAGYRRLRVGDWRVIYRIEGNTVKIVKIGNRRDVYKE